MSRSEELAERLTVFAASVAVIVDELPHDRFGCHVAGQLIRSCTAPAAGYGEACDSESRRDFIHKMKICVKELRETHSWLVLVKTRGAISDSRLKPIIIECNELIAIFVTSIRTARGNQRDRRPRAS